MKKILLTFILIASFAYISKLNAQCTVTGPVLSNISTNTGPSSCTITFDLNFSLTGNGGNKITVLYIWTSSDYALLPAHFYGINDNSVPTSSDINASNALATIKINTDSLLTVFNYQKVSSHFEHPTSMKPSLNYSVVNGSVTVTGISVTVPSCGAPVSLQADVLSSQSPDLSSVGCVAHGLSFIANEPILAGFLGCINPRYFVFSAKTTANTTVTFSAYQDVAPAGLGAEDILLSAPGGFIYSGNGVGGPTPISTYQNITLTTTANTTVSYGQFPFQSALGSKFNVILKVQENGNPNYNTLLIQNTCSLLPVVLKSFTAVRNHSNVLLTWVTSSEQNNSGFQIQRQIGIGNWQTITFVPTQAPGGYSSSDITYTFNDLNGTRGMSNYRIMQVDKDGKFTYSAVRAVRGEGLLSKVVIYPNPSTDGRVNVVFDDANAIRDISLMDVNGRIVKQWKGETNNNLVIDNLSAGFYNLKIIVRETGEQSVEKIVVNKR